MNEQLLFKRLKSLYPITDKSSIDTTSIYSQDLDFIKDIFNQFGVDNAETQTTLLQESIFDLVQEYHPVPESSLPSVKKDIHYQTAIASLSWKLSQEKYPIHLNTVDSIFSTRMDDKTLMTLVASTIAPARQDADNISTLLGVRSAQAVEEIAKEMYIRLKSGFQIFSVKNFYFRYFLRGIQLIRLNNIYNRL
jgi:hypothetical protein